MIVDGRQYIWRRSGANDELVLVKAYPGTPSHFLFFSGVTGQNMAGVRETGDVPPTERFGQLLPLTEVECVSDSESLSPIFGSSPERIEQLRLRFKNWDFSFGTT